MPSPPSPKIDYQYAAQVRTPQTSEASQHSSWSRRPMSRLDYLQPRDPEPMPKHEFDPASVVINGIEYAKNFDSQSNESKVLPQHISGYRSPAQPGPHVPFSFGKDQASVPPQVVAHHAEKNQSIVSGGHSKGWPVTPSPTAALWRGSEASATVGCTHECEETSVILPNVGPAHNRQSVGTDYNIGRMRQDDGWSHVSADKETHYDSATAQDGRVTNLNNLSHQAHQPLHNDLLQAEDLESYTRERAWVSGSPVSSAGLTVVCPGIADSRIPESKCTATAVERSTYPACTLIFCTGEEITGIRLVSASAVTGEFTLSGVCRNVRGTFPASFIQMTCPSPHVAVGHHKYTPPTFSVNAERDALPNNDDDHNDDDDGW